MRGSVLVPCIASTALFVGWILNGVRLVRRADRRLEECNRQDWKIVGLPRPALWVRCINAGVFSPWFATSMLWILRKLVIGPALRKSIRLMEKVELSAAEMTTGDNNTTNAVIPSILYNAVAREAMQDRLDTYYRDLRDSQSLTQFGKIINYVGASLCLNNHHGLLALALQVPATEKVVAPVIIASFPRTGTTILHRTMAQDRESFRTFDLCDMLIPLPSPAPRWDTEGRQKKAKEGEALIGSVEAIYPGWRECLETMHGFRSGEADEDIGWYDAALGHMFMDPLMKLHRECRMRKEGMHSIETKEVAKYRYAWLSMVMKIHQHVDRQKWSSRTDSSGPCPTENLPWLLKDPNHSAYLPELVEVFPDAKIVFSHRPPGDIVASMAKLFVVFVSVDFQPRAPGTTSAEWGAETKRRLEHYSDGLVEFTKSRPAGSDLAYNPDGRTQSTRRIDFYFRDVVRDIPGTIEKIYRQFYPSTPGISNKAAELFKNYLAENERDKHGNQPRSLADFGLEPSDVLYGKYCNLFL